MRLGKRRAEKASKNYASAFSAARFCKPVPQTDKSELLDAGPPNLSTGQQRKSKASWALGVQNTAALFPAAPANNHLFHCLTVLSGAVHFAPQIKKVLHNTLVIGVLERRSTAFFPFVSVRDNASCEVAITVQGG